MDLGTNLNSSALDFATAPDLVTPTGVSGAVHQVTTAGGLVVFTAATSGVYQESATDYVSVGWLETGRIRMGTVESKAWRSVRVTVDSGYSGTVSAYASASETIDPASWAKIVDVTYLDPDQYGSLNSAAPGPLSSLYLAFKMTRAEATVSPVFMGYQLKSVPAPRRAELVQVPVMCFDRESDRQGNLYGTNGGAWLRFAALKQLELTQATVQWQDYTTGEAAEAYIEQVSWDRVTPPTRNSKNAGGIVTVLLRLV
jgi:hypothetical protein